MFYKAFLFWGKKKALFDFEDFSIIALPSLMTLIFQKWLLSHLPSFDIDSCHSLPLSELPFFKPAVGFTVLNQLLLPAAACLLPTAKVALGVIQLQSLYLLLVVAPQLTLVWPSPIPAHCMDIAAHGGSW